MSSNDAAKGRVSAGVIARHLGRGSPGEDAHERDGSSYSEILLNRRDQLS